MSLPKYAVDLARELRKRQTPTEGLLWKNLRGRKFQGLKFLRQHPIVYGEVYKSFFFIADFYCDKAKLIIELDGEVHDFQRDYDENRDQILKELGLRVLRFRNEELGNLDEVLAKIGELTHPPTPSLLRGEGEVKRDGSEPSPIALDSSLKEDKSDQIQTSKGRTQLPTSPSLRSREGVAQRAGGELAIILLAAGSSSRMGQSKQLLSIDGKPLLLKSAEAALGAGAGKTIVVLGSDEKAHRKIIRDMSLEIIYNPEWAKGMGTSLRVGLSYALKMVSGLKAVMIMACDQPLVKSLHLKTLIQKYLTTKSSIVASAYANTVGVPALFDQSLFQKLLAVEDGQGAKKILLAHAESVVSVAFPDGAVDLDTPEDYKAFLKFRNLL